MASRRLTKALRDSTIRVIMDDVPKPDEEQCSKEFMELVKAVMPPEVLSAYLIDPKWLVDHAYNVTADSNKCGWEYYSKNQIYLHYNWYTYGREGWSAAMIKYADDLADILTNRILLMKKLEGILADCRTVKQFKDMLPEFEKYAPDETIAPTKNTPVTTNLMAEVVALGWPGGKIVNAHIVQGGKHGT